ncbi:ankyrin repeat domain-containing protein, partial [Corallococcus sp. CA041A]|uniref:ankyrin repeat domain-containing protein n=1 Tax=Corallococcus sp. CA041A TaxID=2316727 RepID=UPI0011C41179
HLRHLATSIEVTHQTPSIVPMRRLTAARWPVSSSLAQDRIQTPDSRPDDLNSSLQLAARNGHVEVVRLLLKAGADPNGTKFSNPVPLLDAADRLREDKGDPTMMKLLLDAGARVDVKHFGGSPLTVAANGCSAEVVSLLLRKMSRGAIAEEPGTYLYAQALRAGDFCTEARSVKVLQALLSGGVRIREQRDMHGDFLVTRARESRAIRAELVKAGLHLSETP